MMNVSWFSFFHLFFSLPPHELAAAVTKPSKAGTIVCCTSKPPPLGWVSWSGGTVLAPGPHVSFHRSGFGFALAAAAGGAGAGSTAAPLFSASCVSLVMPLASLDFADGSLYVLDCFGDSKSWSAVLRASTLRASTSA